MPSTAAFPREPAARRRKTRSRAPQRRPFAGARTAEPPELAPAALVAENLTLVAELARVQRRCTEWRDEGLRREERLEAQLMRARALSIAKDTRLAALRESLDALRRRAALWLTNEELLRRLADLRAHNRSLECELAESRRAVDALRIAGDAWIPAANDAQLSSAGAPLGGASVLCIGLRTRQLPACRTLVERAGGRFTHANGTAGDDPALLERLLADAAIVLLQAGYVCRDACLAVSRHCERAGKRCVRIDKPCIQSFARGLSEAADAR